MYNEKIEALISAALADGVLTEKEKQILFKNAQAQGIDLDEFEMVLDARLAELQKAEKEKTEKSAPKSTKFGDVRKCPACGAIVASGTASCGECGYAFNEDASVSAMDKLYERLDVIDQQFSLKNRDAMEDILTGNRMTEKIEMTNKKMQAIRTFNISNTRAELLSVLTAIQQLANPKGPKSGLKRNYTLEDLSLAYWDLYVNCINKAKVSFANDPAFAPYFAKYDKMISDPKKSKARKIKILLGIIGAVVLGIVIISISNSISSRNAEELKAQEAAQINNLRATFNKYIADGDADNAKATLQELGLECYDEALSLIKLYIANGDVYMAIDVYENLTPNHCDMFSIEYSHYRHGSNNQYEPEATKLIRNELIKLGDYDLVWHYYEKKSWGNDPNDYLQSEHYYRFMVEIVNYLCDNDNKQAARKFVNKFNQWFEMNVDVIDKSYDSYKNYNSSITKSKLNNIINNY